MKCIFIAVLVILFAASCDDGTTKPGDAGSQYSGRFDITYRIFDGNCLFGLDPRGASDITIRGTSITFGSMKGSWTESEKHGYGRYAFGTQCPDHNPRHFAQTASRRASSSHSPAPTASPERTVSGTRTTIAAATAATGVMR